MLKRGNSKVARSTNYVSWSGIPFSVLSITSPLAIAGLLPGLDLAFYLHHNTHVNLGLYLPSFTTSTMSSDRRRSGRISRRGKSSILHNSKSQSIVNPLPFPKMGKFTDLNPDSHQHPNPVLIALDL